MKDEQAAENIEFLKSRVEPAVRHLGIELEELSPGYARASVVITPQHLNFHNLAFGGVIVSLADHAFGYAANSLAYPSVASQFNIHFLESAGPGDRLTAESRVVKHGRRLMVSEIRVTNSRGDLVALATGTTVNVSAGSSSPEARKPENRTG